MSTLKPWVQRLVLSSALIAALNCFSRADYNLPLFIFAYMAWNLQRTQKPRIAWMLVITFFFDLIWILYWSPLFNSYTFVSGYWENGVHGFVMILSIVNVFLKLVIIILVYLTEIDVKKSFTLDGITEGLSDFFA